tara:strand:+ start:209 stop:385 length:177 start_codon:yes stop_codon:yes gene_type:complete
MISKKNPEATKLGEKECRLILEVIYNSRDLHGSTLELLVQTTKKVQEILNKRIEEKYK